MLHFTTKRHLVNTPLRVMKVAYLHPTVRRARLPARQANSGAILEVAYQVANTNFERLCDFG